SRQHYGYAAQNGLQSGGYSSRLVTDAPRIILGNSKDATPLPIVVLADSPGLSTFADMIAGLKGAGLARIVEETGSAEGRLLANVKLVDNVEVHVTTSEIIAPDGRVGISPDLTVPREATGERALDVAVGLVLTWSAATAAPAPQSFTLQPTRDKSYPE